MNLRRVMACVALIVALVSAGCKASDGDGAPGGGPAATTGAAAGDTGAGDASAPVSAAALCAHLKKQLPRIQAVGSEVGAEAQLALTIADLYSGHEDKLDGNEIDAQALKSCPETRAALLKASGLETLASL